MVDFPGSKPRLRDLKACMERSKLCLLIAFSDARLTGSIALTKELIQVTNSSSLIHDKKQVECLFDIMIVLGFGENGLTSELLSIGIANTAKESYN